MHNLSGNSLQFIFFFIFKQSVLLSRVLGKKWRVESGKKLCSVGLQCAPLCACCFCDGISVSCTESPYRPIDKSTIFFLAPDFINSLISQHNGEYGQWMTTQNVRKKILHALHFKLTLLIKYFSSYIKKCQKGTYFFGWVYL